MDRIAKQVEFWLSLAVGLALIAQSASGATFRVTTKVYDGEKSNPSAEHRILFDEGLVYDLPQIADRFVTVFDEAQNQVTLLDRQTQVQTSLSISDLEKITAQARAAADSPEKQQQLGLLAKVQPSKEVVGYAIKYGNLEYNTSTQTPDDRSIAVDYARFVILASRLNIVRRLGTPPFGRMTLNHHMAERGELPQETRLKLRRGRHTEEFRSTHELDELTPADREQIDEVRGMLNLYREVTLKDFPAERDS